MARVSGGALPLLDSQVCPTCTSVSSPLQLCVECTLQLLEGASAQASSQVSGLYAFKPIAQCRHAIQARDKHSFERPPCNWESRRVGRMRARLAPQQAFINALRIRDGCRKDWMVVRVRFPCKNASYPHYDRPVFCDLRRARSLEQGICMENAWFLKLHCSKHTD